MSNGNGLKYHLDIEGNIHPWDHDTITREQIAELGGWDPELGVVEIDKDNNERTLQSNEVVQLKPGVGFSKKVHWKRGFLLDDRIAQELPLIRAAFGDAEYKDRWIRVPRVQLPPGWNKTEISVAAHFRNGYPGISPYGIYVPHGMRFNEKRPDSYTEPSPQQPPFEGVWAIFSWEAQKWTPSANPTAGHHMVNFLQGILQRFKEGA